MTTQNLMLLRSVKWGTLLIALIASTLLTMEVLASFRFRESVEVALWVLAWLGFSGFIWANEYYAQAAESERGSQLLRESRVYAAVYLNYPNAAFTLDEDGIIAVCSKSFARDSNTLHAELFGMHISKALNSSMDDHTDSEDLYQDHIVPFQQNKELYQDVQTSWKGSDVTLVMAKTNRVGGRIYTTVTIKGTLLDDGAT